VARRLPPGLPAGKGEVTVEGVVAMDNAAGKAQRPKERKGRDAHGIDGGREADQAIFNI